MEQYKLSPEELDLKYGSSKAMTCVIPIKIGKGKGEPCGKQCKPGHTSCDYHVKQLRKPRKNREVEDVPTPSSINSTTLLTLDAERPKTPSSPPQITLPDPKSLPALPDGIIPPTSNDISKITRKETIQIQVPPSVVQEPSTIKDDVSDTADLMNDIKAVCGKDPPKALTPGEIASKRKIDELCQRYPDMAIYYETSCDGTYLDKWLQLNEQFKLTNSINGLKASGLRTIYIAEMLLPKDRLDISGLSKLMMNDPVLADLIDRAGYENRESLVKIPATYHLLLHIPTLIGTVAASNAVANAAAKDIATAYNNAKNNNLTPSTIQPPVSAPSGQGGNAVMMNDNRSNSNQNRYGADIPLPPNFRPY